MKTKVLLLAAIFGLTACNTNQGSTEQIDALLRYGVFLGANSSDTKKISAFDKAIIDVDEFTKADLSYLRAEGCEVYAYLSVGSLEKYRSYYNEYKDLTFMDYENWPDERWIDVSNEAWQNHLTSEATRFKQLGAQGLFMDNFDVYYIASEEYEGDQVNKEDIYEGCKKILSNFANLGMKLIINSGTDFLERMHDENNELVKKIDCYCQECVFSSIVDYENNVFGKQDQETTDYYKSIISFMDDNSEILLLEYTVDKDLKNEIIKYCADNLYYFYLSSSIDLK